jgi:hypothetical protein
MKLKARRKYEKQSRVEDTDENIERHGNRGFKQWTGQLVLRVLQRAGLLLVSGPQCLDEMVRETMHLYEVCKGIQYCPLPRLIAFQTWPFPYRIIRIGLDLLLVLCHSVTI